MFYLSELEAKEACDWLRAAGFPQYAQLYEGNQCFCPQCSELITWIQAPHISTLPLSSAAEGWCYLSKHEKHKTQVQ